MDYYAIYKPFGMMSQFTKESDKPVLGELFDFPKDVYPVGRLDHDSEGLLILTNDKSLNHKVLNPKQKSWKTYWVQVDGDITEDALKDLETGVTLNYKGKLHHTLRAKCKKIDPSNIPDRTPPVRFRKNIPTSWIALSICEGKNRQVRKMTAKVGFPTLRLIRVQIGDYCFDELEIGAVIELSADTVQTLHK